MAETHQEVAPSYTANLNQKVYDTAHVVDHEVNVLDIYFAEKVKKYKLVDKEETYTVKGTGKIADVLKKYEKKGRLNLTATPNHAKPLKPKEQIKITWQEQVEDGFSYNKLNRSKVGKTVFIVALCNASKAKLSIEIFENKFENTALVYDNPVKFLIGDDEKTKIDFSITQDKNEYIQEIILRPKANNALKTLLENFEKRSDKNAFLYFKALVTETTDEVKFPNNINEFRNQKLDRFEIKIKQTCPVDAAYRSHFVLHCTAGNMSEASIKEHTSFDTDARKRSKAHKYIMPDGKVIEIWSFTEKNVWATKAESKNNLKGQMFHVEINYGSPSVPSYAQYNSLADLYLEASDIEECWPIIVPHLEVDRGIPDGHGDPTDFDYDKFYKLLKDKVVPIDTIPHFEHDRYWGDKSYKVPWGNDKNSWPPILKGNPHK